MAICITPIVSADVRLTSRTWEFAKTTARQIDAHWASRSAQQPSLFNGNVILLDRWVVRKGHFSGECIKTDFKSFLYWREHGAPDPDVADFFAAGALHASEGWLILGRAAAAMSNAGKVYPPCGSLNIDECRNGSFDLDASIVREIREETGIEISQPQLGPMLLIEALPQIVVIRPVMVDRPASEIVDKIYHHLRQASAAELAEIIIVRDAKGIERDGMPEFAVAYLEHVFLNESAVLS